MADINELKEIGEELKPLIEVLIDLSRAGNDSVDPTATNEVLDKLEKLLNEANSGTEIDPVVAAQAINESAARLRELRDEARANPALLTPGKKRLISLRLRILTRAQGRILAGVSIGSIARLLRADDLSRIRQELAGAREEIARRETAKAALDAVVTVAIVSAKVAAKLA